MKGFQEMYRTTVAALAAMMLLSQSASAVTLLVDFGPFSGSGFPGAPTKTVSTSADFATANSFVDLSAAVNDVDLVLPIAAGSSVTGLSGIGIDADITFTTAPSGGFGQGGAIGAMPIVGSALVARSRMSTLTISGLEEIAAGEVVTLTTYGGGDRDDQFTTFTTVYDGVTSPAQIADPAVTTPGTNVAFTFTKADGVDSIDVIYGNDDTFSNFGGFSITTLGAPEDACNINGIGGCNSSDFEILRDNLFTNGSFSDGDVAGGGFIDFADFRAFKDNPLRTTGFDPSAAASASTSVPEPSTALLVGASLMIGGLSRRGERQRIS